VFLCPAPILSPGPQIHCRNDADKQRNTAKQDNDAGHGSPLLTSAMTQPVKNIQIARPKSATNAEKGASSRN
jgi:hypothetical protein